LQKFVKYGQKSFIALAPGHNRKHSSLLSDKEKKVSPGKLLNQLVLPDRLFLKSMFLKLFFFINDEKAKEAIVER
jgi:hypothetical protein